MPCTSTTVNFVCTKSSFIAICQVKIDAFHSPKESDFIQLPFCFLPWEPMNYSRGNVPQVISVYNMTPQKRKKKKKKWKFQFIFLLLFFFSFVTLVVLAGCMHWPWTFLLNIVSTFLIHYYLVKVVLIKKIYYSYLY